MAAVWILIIIAILFFCLLYALYSRAVRCTDEQKRRPVRLPDKEDYYPYYEQMQKLVDEMQEQPFEDVWISSRDGLKLFGRYLHVRDGAPVAIQAHGYRSGGIRDFCGGNKIAREHGINTLLIDMRAHGKSEGHTLTFGIRERYDVLDWIGYIQERFGKETPVILSGISMGAATVLMTADLPLPEAVRCITADSPYTSPEAIIRKVIRHYGLPDGLFFPLVALGARVFGRVDLKETGALTAVKNAKIPILLMHGTADGFVPYSMSEELRDACASPVQLELFEGAPHGIGYILEPERYERMLLEFLEKSLKSPSCSV